MISFVAYTAAETANAFQLTRQPPQIVHYHGGISNPSNNGSLGQCKPAP